MSLRILEAGLYTLVVDHGRPRSRSLGVPLGGAADRTSLAVGNALVGNPPDAAALEFSLAGPTLQAECELACVVHGAPFDLRSDRRKLRTGRTFTLQPGERLRVGGAREGMRAYLCVAGGVQTKPVLGSRTSLEPLKADDVVPCLPGRIQRRYVEIEWQWDRPPELEVIKRQLGLKWPGRALRIVDGPQTAWFSPTDFILPSEQIPNFFSVSKSSNRMGIRLQGTPLLVPDRELVSEPVAPGAVQVTRDGQCIILGIDGQTIGGYPKVAQVISADLDTLGQLRPGGQVFFQRVTLEEAERLYRGKQDEVRRWVTRIRAAVGGT